MGVRVPQPTRVPQGRGGQPLSLLSEFSRRLPPARAPHARGFLIPRTQTLGSHPGFSMSSLAAGNESPKERSHDGCHQASKAGSWAS